MSLASMWSSSPRLLARLSGVAVVVSLGGVSCVERAELFPVVEGASSTAARGGTAGDASFVPEGPSEDIPPPDSGAAGGPSTSIVPGPSGKIVQVEGGSLHTCAVLDGQLHCWGGNSAGQLGLGDYEERLVASRLGSNIDWSQVGAGAEFSCGLRSGAVFCWGDGSRGQLAGGEFGSSSTPLRVDLPQAVLSITVGSAFACAVLEDGSLYCWGNNAEGQLAQDDPFPDAGVDLASPALVPGGPWAQVAGGDGHACAIDQSGSLYCWGRNLLGELGLGESAAGQHRVPLRVGSDSDWLAVAAGQNHTCGIRAGNALYCWGNNASGQLGVGDTEVRREPTRVAALETVDSVAVDTFHTCATTAGALYCWGRSVEGQLGVADLSQHDSPVQAEPSETRWVSTGVGRFHSCAVGESESGELFVACTGGGPLGVGDSERRYELTPTVVAP